MTKMHAPPHPGSILREDVLPALGLSVTEAAAQLGVGRVALSRVVNGAAAMSADLAIRLAQALGGSAQSWLRLQADYDVWKLSHTKRARILPIKFSNDDSFHIAA